MACRFSMSDGKSVSNLFAAGEGDALLRRSEDLPWVLFLFKKKPENALAQNQPWL